MTTTEIDVMQGVDAPTPRSSPPRKVEHFTRDQRTARGRADRSEVPRSSHAAFEPVPHRSDPVDVLEAQAASRVPELVPVRYGRMLVSPFTFYRGAAALMASDLAGTARTGLHAQLCGDAHLSNFGIFAAPDRRLVFTLNDFDETLPGPFEWDVKRLVASFAVAGRDVDLDAQQRESVNLLVTRSYRTAMRDFAQMRSLELWYSRLDIDEIAAKVASRLNKSQLKQFERNVAKARTKDSMKAFARLTHVVDGVPRIVSDPPLIVPVDELLASDQARQFEKAMRAVIRSYRRTMAGDRQHLLEQFRYADAARKVVGVGSVGTRAWIVLMVGADEGDPLFLQVKEAQSSVLEPFVGKSRFPQHGQRVVEGQRLIQSASDIMLGWFRSPGIDGVARDFYIRQLWDSKGSALIETMGRRQLGIYAEICGWTLARAHARSGDAVAIASYLGAGDTFDQAVASFAEAYADQNLRDYDALRNAVDTGRITAHSGI